MNAASFPTKIRAASRSMSRTMISAAADAGMAFEPLLLLASWRTSSPEFATMLVATAPALAALRARAFTEDQLLASRYRLIETMRADLLAAIHAHTERIFRELLASGALSFRLEGNGLNWELVEKLAFEVTQPPDYQITHKDRKSTRLNS